MQKNKKKGKQTNTRAASASTTDDFDGMLAEFRSVDLAASPASSSASTASNGPPAPIVAEETLMKALIEGDLTSLRRWGWQGFRPISASPFCAVAAVGSVDVMRCMVKELGADVNKPSGGDANWTPLFLAANAGRVDMVRAWPILVLTSIDVGKVAPRSCICQLWTDTWTWCAS